MKKKDAPPGRLYTSCAIRLGLAGTEDEEGTQENHSSARDGVCRGAACCALCMCIRVQWVEPDGASEGGHKGRPYTAARNCAGERLSQCHRSVWSAPHACQPFILSISTMAFWILASCRSLTNPEQIPLTAESMWLSRPRLRSGWRRPPNPTPPAPFPQTASGEHVEALGACA